MLALAHCLVVALAGCQSQPRPEPGILFLDFDGMVLERGVAPGQSSCLRDDSVEIAPVPGIEARRAAITARVRELLSGFPVDVTDEDPGGDIAYDRVVFGGDPMIMNLSLVLGFSCRVDCGGEHTGDVAMVFEVATLQLDDTQLGTLAVHEAGHAWGLEHVLDENDVMYQLPLSRDASLRSGCLELDPSEPLYCKDSHAADCPAGRQDSHAELHRRFGPVEDVVLTGAILFPEDGAVLPPATWSVDVALENARAWDAWLIRVPEADFEIHASGPQGACGVELVGAGAYTIQLAARRDSGEDVLDEIHIEIELQEDEPVPACGTCRSGDRSSSSGAMWAIAGLWALRRRRAPGSGSYCNARFSA